ncbi:hypothetical protein B1F79_00240 [Coxiella-like endosymbiont of Rhipicephalus sanguineus]|nr:hypothetical protein [Coxiella-like endosymbiont of Rhipicephalus sanguineus]
MDLPIMLYVKLLRELVKFYIEPKNMDYLLYFTIFYYIEPTFNLSVMYLTIGTLFKILKNNI